MLKELLKERNLPPLRTREEMVELLQREEYGYLPKVEWGISVGEPEVINWSISAASVVIDKVPFTVTTPNGSHTFPLYRMLHNDQKKRPFFININFHDIDKGFYFPAEIIADNGGFDVLFFNYTDVTSDDDDFLNGVAPLLLPNGRENDTDCGKLMMWAWTAMRVMDYAETLSCLDLENAAVIGHSRLGKTALITSMLDTRFKFAFSNNAGCSGDALARGSLGQNNPPIKWEPTTKGESIEFMTKTFPFWFCKNYLKYAENNCGDDFDQHYLLASIAPRYVYVASASMDMWADPESEQLCCLAASVAWEQEGLKGFIHNDKFLEPNEALQEGRVGYHKRYGMHFLSYHDWQRFMEYINKHK